MVWPFIIELRTSKLFARKRMHASIQIMLTKNIVAFNLMADVIDSYINDIDKCGKVQEIRMKSIESHWMDKFE